MIPFAALIAAVNTAYVGVVLTKYSQCLSGNCLPCRRGQGPAGMVGGLSSAQAAISNDLMVSTTFLPC
jgi:hypothetical protein